jgi:hypothetical protein
MSSWVGSMRHERKRSNVYLLEIVDLVAGAVVLAAAVTVAVAVMVIGALNRETKEVRTEPRIISFEFPQDYRDSQDYRNKNGNNE